MPFKDLSEFLNEDEPLTLPVEEGKEYTFPGAINGHDWLLLHKITDQQQDALSEDEDPVLYAEQRALSERLYGDVEKQMATDGCTNTQIKAVLATATVFYLQGREAAEAFWEIQGWALTGESPAPNRAARRHPDRATQSTRSRGSAAGTTRRKSPAAKPPDGQKSSSSGT